MADFFNYTLRCMCYYQGVQLSPLGFAACQSKNCTNKETTAHPKKYILLINWCT